MNKNVIFAKRLDNFVFLLGFLNFLKILLFLIILEYDFVK